MAKKRNPTKCANCQAEVWLGAFFVGPFLCEDCQGRAASIILRLKKRLTKRAPDRATECEKHVLYMACGYNYCPDCGKPRGR